MTGALLTGLPLLGAVTTAGTAHRGHRVLHLLQRDRHPGAALQLDRF